MRALILFAGFVLVASACNALDAPGPEGSLEIIPVDDRPALLTAAPPAPISGGTLAVSSDGMTAVAADPDRDRVSIVDLDASTVRHVALEKGDEPGRVVLDPAGRAFVALRRSGALAVIDLVHGSLVQRMPVCSGPRGMAFDAAQGLLHVACMEGRLLSLRAASGSTLEIANDVRVELDLRDVIMQGEQLWVSTFKRAELLRVGENGQVHQRFAPNSFAALDFASFDSSERGAPAQMQPRVAYRSLADGAGNMLMLHQAESDGEVAIDQPADGGGSPYGGLGACSGIVTPALTKIEPNGRVITLPTSSGVLSVDMAFAPEQNMLAIVQAGASDADAPLRQRFFDSGGTFGESPTSGFAAPTVFGGGNAGGTGTLVTVFDMAAPDSSCKFGQSLFVPGQSTAIALRPSASAALDQGLSSSAGWVVQSREPARLFVLPTQPDFSGSELRQIDLGGETMRDTGHEIFHRDAGGGIACASCHAEGAEDGHVWHFTRLGARRTQALHIGLEGTAPFHWGGDERDLDNLMTDVFVGRMGGVHQSTDRTSALSRWLFALQPPAAPVSLDHAAVERGRELFMSAAVGCNECHSGEKLTNNRNVDVGTGEALQVPSLRGIAYRAPFMHNGCAATLRDRFTLVCGGATHGNISQLSAESLDDLLAFLQTL